MTVFTENPLPIVMIGILVAGTLITFGVILAKRKMIWGGVFAILITLGLTILESYIVTDKEAIQNQIYGMARCVRKNDVEGLMEYAVAENNNRHGLYARSRIAKEMPDYDFKACRVAGINIEYADESKTEAEVSFMAYVTVDATRSRYNYSGMASRRVILKLQKQQDGEWKVIYIDHADPAAGVRL